MSLVSHQFKLKSFVTSKLATDNKNMTVYLKEFKICLNCSYLLWFNSMLSMLYIIFTRHMSEFELVFEPEAIGFNEH